MDRKPWEADVTLCIAALCMSDIGPAPYNVVFSFDHRAETYEIGGDNEVKYHVLSPRWVAFISGTLARAYELVNRYKRYLSDERVRDEITDENVIDYLYVPLNEYRDALADRYVRSRLAVTYENFRERGRSEFPKSLYESIANDISRQQLEVSLLLVGLLPSQRFRIYRVGQDGADECSNFGAIGSGSPIAEGALYQREHRRDWGLSKTIYAVYEAQRLGQAAPGVGANPSFGVLRYIHDSKSVLTQVVPKSQDAFLEQQYAKFGLRPIAPFALPDNFLHPQLF